MIGRGREAACIEPSIVTSLLHFISLVHDDVIGGGWPICYPGYASSNAPIAEIRIDGGDTHASDFVISGVCREHPRSLSALSERHVISSPGSGLVQISVHFPMACRATHFVWDPRPSAC